MRQQRTKTIMPGSTRPCLGPAAASPSSSSGHAAREVKAGLHKILKRATKKSTSGLPLSRIVEAMRYIPVLHSVSYAGVWRGQACLTVEQFLDKAVELGFPAIALVAKRPHVSPLDYDEAARRQLRQAIESRKLQLAALMGYTDFTASLGLAGVAPAEMNAVYVEALARLAADLGTTRIRIMTGYLRPDIPVDRQHAEVVTGLKLAARAAARYGVTLCVQNHHDLCIDYRSMIWLLEEVGEPNVKAAFDAWAPFLQGLRGDALVEAVKAMGPWIGWTTVADYVRLPQFRYRAEWTNYERLPIDLVRAVPCGDGEVDYEAFFRGLREAGYQGFVAYEMCEVLRGGGSIENLDRTARRFLEWLKRWE